VGGGFGWGGGGGVFGGLLVRVWTLWFFAMGHFWLLGPLGGGGLDARVCADLVVA